MGTWEKLVETLNKLRWEVQYQTELTFLVRVEKCSGIQLASD